jgi:organic radical activating enzyme
MKTYRVNEMFYSPQGEGIRAGTVNVFIRFTGCNLKCAVGGDGNFDCDTEFVSGRDLTIDEILAAAEEMAPNCKAVILTGGEPALQVDDELIAALKGRGYYIAIETNGTKELPQGIDWITVSPKTAEHTIRQLKASEVKYVRCAGMGIPRPVVKADYYLISPAFQSNGALHPEDAEWCVRLVKTNPTWRLSIQTHKWLRQR